MNETNEKKKKITKNGKLIKKKSFNLILKVSTGILLSTIDASA